MIIGLHDSALVLVEGISDKIAVETLATRRGRDLAAEGVSVVAIGGAQALGKALRQIAAQEREIRLAGLCDAREEAGFQRALEHAGLGPGRTRASMEKIGFYVCEPDLEGELIEALGPTGVEALLAEHGDLGPFRTLQKQPQWRGRPTHDQLRRFMGSGGRRKIKYARVLVEALDVDRVPRPLHGVLGHV
jgi:hypothetical protein